MENKQYRKQSNKTMYCGLGKQIVLSIFTFGIWNLIWIYRTTRFSNKSIFPQHYNPRNELLLCMFVPFYQIYWFYRMGQRFDVILKHSNLNNTEIAPLCLIFGMFMPLGAYILMQDKINVICTTKEFFEEQ